MSFKTIMVPYDMSEPAEHALGIALDITRRDPLVNLHIVHIILAENAPHFGEFGPNTMGISAGGALDPEALAALVRASIDAEHKRVVEHIGDAAHGIEERVTIESVSAPAIVEGITGYADKQGCDLIVMGRRGLGGLRGMLGSISKGVLHTTPIPVLTVR